MQGVSGFALALVTAVFWSGALPPQMAAPLVAICSIGGQALTIRAVWPSLDWRLAGPMVAGGLLGVPVGAAMLPSLDPAAFRLGVGILLCVYCPVMLAARRMQRLAWGGRRADAAAGLASGVLGGLAGLSGPASIVWCSLRGWPRDVQRAVFQTVLIAIQAASIVAYGITGLLTAELGRLTAWVLPCVLVTSYAGARVYRRLGGETVRRVVLGLLLVTGLVLVAQASGF